MASFAKINSYGFIETPYFKVEKGKVTDTVEYLNAFEEERHIIAHAGVGLDDKGRIIADKVGARIHGEPGTVSKDQIDYIDVSPNQSISVGTALIPFLRNDDANRALMGSNMQRQAVPLVKPEVPYVGTGLIANSHAAVAGSMTTGPEMFIIGNALDVVQEDEMS